MKTLTVKKKKVVSLFRALGFATVDKWGNAKLQSKANSLHKLDIDVKLKPKKKTFLTKILKVLKKKGKVVIEEVAGAQAASAEADAKTKAKKTKKKASKKTEGTDRFGRRLGTQGAKIDESVSNKPKTLKAIKKDCRLPLARVRNHMTWLVSKGFVKKTDKGYLAVKELAKKKKKKK